MTSYNIRANPMSKDFIGNSFTYINKEGKSKTFVAPRFNIEDDMCAKFARLSAEERFGKDFNRSDAWNLKYANRTKEPLSDLSNAEIGDIITFYFPASDYNTRGQKNRDEYGNIRDATHAGLVVGYGYGNKPIILHQFHSDIEVGFLDDIERKRRISHREIIKPRN